MTEASKTCSAWSSDGRMSFHCTRPVKDEGLCAQHLAGKKRRAINNQQRAEKSRQTDAVRIAAEEACTRLASHGLDAVPEYSAIRLTYTGRVALNPAALLAILEPTDA